VCGCGGGESYEFVPVSGRVTLGGEPVANARVSFQPASGQTNPGPGSSGVTDADGRYTLQAATPAREQGALVGKHVVTISTASEPSDDAAGASSGLPPQAGSGSLTFDVPPGGSQAADFDLTPK
jgi:hypothetical protein